MFCCFPLLAVGDILSASVLTSGPFFSMRLCSSTCIWGVVLVLLSFCPHVVSRLSPHIIFWGVVISYIEALPSLLRLIWFVSSDMCVILFLFVFVYRVTRCKHHLVWIYRPFSCFTFLCQFFSLQSCNPLFGLQASYLNFYLWLMLTYVFWYVCTL